MLTNKKPTYCIWALGCAMNKADAERVAMVLDNQGYTEVASEKDADVIIVVACSVRQSGIDRILGKAPIWRELKKKNPRLKTILTGCVLKQDLPTMKKIFDLTFNILELNDLPKMLNKLKFKNQIPNGKFTNQK